MISSCAFQNLVSQMEDFEACAEPLQDCLSATEQVVQESSMRLHDLAGKKLELQKLQVPPAALLILTAAHIQVPPSLALSFAARFNIT